ncbi:hypothetical protein PMIN01_11316 [Paraphaeosphaeria minitans]|uniref:Uncharacterized protein n=1 Tax=Paraphaeosphaeria minitans TaxID=565426 RepID=A0A9P6KL23_9PLEO|nr:hypothetical protein PMIN01_11316 [Paraphaeosphaeria minitans]
MEKSAAIIVAPSLPGRRSLTLSLIRPPTIELDIRVRPRNTTSSAYARLSTGKIATLRLLLAHCSRAFTCVAAPLQQHSPQQHLLVAHEPQYYNKMEEFFHLLSLLVALFLSIALMDVPNLRWLTRASDIYLIVNAVLMWVNLLGHRG